MNMLFNTIKYRFERFRGVHSAPVPYAIPIKVKDLTPKTQEPYDLNGRQIYMSGPIIHYDGMTTFQCKRLTVDEQVAANVDFMAHYQDWGVPKYPWVYKSMACNSFNQFRIDIYKPGRMMVECTLPKYTWASVWLYCSMNKGDFNKPLLDIDKPKEPREYYFEIDLFETMMDPQKVIFTGHWGTQAHREHDSAGLYWKDDLCWHHPEVVWDGKGNWEWYLDGILVNKAFVSQPEEKIYPYLLLTLGMSDDYPNISYPINWFVNFIHITNNIIKL